jgi:hypothetical protein
VEFLNDKQEKRQIFFKQMEDHCGDDVRRIRRKVVDSLLPDVSQ